MLFLLTGDVQIGKTRWLERLYADLADAGVCVAGVVAPGQWVPRAEGEPGGKHGLDGAGRFEKLGIDNVLLPQGERIEFARRRDLASAGQAFAEGSQAKAAQLGWAISDEAIAQVNLHFAKLAKAAKMEQGSYSLGASQTLTTTESSAIEQPNRPAHQASECAKMAKERSVTTDSADMPRIAPGSFLVVDELGRLELLRGCGLTNAVTLLDAGPTPTFPHALAVVRETLLDEAVRRFATAWGEPRPIAPDDEARELVFNAFEVR